MKKKDFHDDMKRGYIAPAVEVVDLASGNLLAESDSIMINDEEVDKDDPRKDDSWGAFI